MARRFDSIEKNHEEFVKRQHVFFVATARTEGIVGLSPKGMDTMRIIGPNSVVWLNLTGSGNETSLNVQDNGRMTVMFCSFDKDPLVLRFYGKATVVHPRDAEWSDLIPMFGEFAGARQIFSMKVDIVMESCGYAVPYLEYKGERDLLTKWTESRGRAGVEKYWKEYNALSLDGRKTNIVEE